LVGGRHGLRGQGILLGRFTFQWAVTAAAACLFCALGYRHTFTKNRRRATPHAPLNIKLDLFTAPHITTCTWRAPHYHGYGDSLGMYSTHQWDTTCAGTNTWQNTPTPHLTSSCTPNLHTTTHATSTQWAASHPTTFSHAPATILPPPLPLPYPYHTCLPHHTLAT